MTNKMPREIAPGVFWIGDCLAQRHKGKVYHGYNAAFLVAGDTASCLVETGHPKDFPVIERHMNELFAQGIAPRWISPLNRDPMTRSSPASSRATKGARPSRG